MQQPVDVRHVRHGDGAQLHPRDQARVVGVGRVGDVVLREGHVVQRHVSDGAVAGHPDDHRNVAASPLPRITEQ